MTCAQELQQSMQLSTMVLCIQIVISFFIFRKKIEEKKERSFWALTLVLLVVHPRFWLVDTQDCGEELLKTSILFVVSAFFILFWVYGRERLQKSKKSSS